MDIYSSHVFKYEYFLKCYLYPSRYSWQRECKKYGTNFLSWPESAINKNVVNLWVLFVYMDAEYSNVQGSIGMQTMPDKLVFIPNDDAQNYPSVDYNYWLKSFATQLNESKFNKFPKLLRHQIKKRYYKTLGTSVVNSQLSPPSLQMLVLGFWCKLNAILCYFIIPPKL